MCSCRANRGRLLGILIVAAFAACSESATDTSPQPAEVVVEPSEATLDVSDTLRLAATVYDTEGNPVQGSVNWESLHPEVADVDAFGLVTAYASGRIDIYAVYEGSAGATSVSGSSLITVNCVTPPPVLVRITTDAAMQNSPAISGMRIVWQDWRNHPADDADIYLYDLETQQETRLTPNSAWQGLPDIWGDRVVWSDTRNGLQAIYMHDLSTGQERRLAIAPRVQSSPSIEGDRVVWQENDGVDYDIYMFDIGTSSYTQLTDQPGDQKNPRISGRRVVWVDESGADFDVIVYDLDTSQETRLTDGEPGNQQAPAISGDRVVWQYVPNVWVHDLSTGARANLTDGLGANLPDIDGDWVTWVGSQLVARNLETGEEWQVGYQDFVAHSEPRISGRRVVWERIETSEFDIYMIEIPEPCQNNFVSERRP